MVYKRICIGFMQILLLYTKILVFSTSLKINGILMSKNFGIQWSQGSNSPVIPRENKSFVTDVPFYGGFTEAELAETS